MRRGAMARKSHVVVVYAAGRAPVSYGPYYARESERVATVVASLLERRGIDGYALAVPVEPFPLAECSDGVQLELEGVA